MRRLLLVLLSIAAVLSSTALLMVGTPAGAQAPTEDRRRGLVFDGLKKSPGNELCGDAFQSFLDSVDPGMKPFICTHGPDPAPDGVDVRQRTEPLPAEAITSQSPVTAADGGSVPCYGTGTDGFRVQLLYAHGTGTADRLPALTAQFRSEAGRLDGVVNTSAGQTGGTRHVRFVTDSTCDPIIQSVTLSSSAMTSFSSMVSALHAQGFTRTDRKYLVWSDANTYCGIAELYVDANPDTTPGANANNGNPGVQGTIARVDNGCWLQNNMVEAHELLHMLGGVQPGAPNATPGYHCTDGYDRLCYNDGSTSKPQRTNVCPISQLAFYDCRHDDYFSTAPPFGSWLSRNWNTANSSFLSSQGGVGPPPPTTTTTSTTTTSTTSTTSTTVPSSTTTSTTSTSTTSTSTSSTSSTSTSSTSSTSSSSTTSTTQPPAATPPSEPRSLVATQPGVGGGVQLSWDSPASGPVTGYRIYRGTSPANLTMIKEIGKVNGYTDVTAGPSLYFYKVSAYNAAGEGPASALAGMVGKAAAPAGAVSQQGDRKMVVSNSLRPIFAWRFA